MTMQRRHFELIAEVLKEAIFEQEADAAKAMREHIALAFAHKLAATNSNFNRPRFLRACGVED